MSEIILPNEWQARDYQRKLFDYMLSDGMRNKRAVNIWHRRAGKDSSSLNLGAIATQIRVGTYWHMLPTLNQAKKVIWKGIDKRGRRMIDQAFPKGMRKQINESDMSIEMVNGSIWQCVGSDNYDSLVGANPIGVIFSEYSIADPAAWNYIRPILRENGGWAVFIYTARGQNHGFHLHEMARDNPKWYYSNLTIDDTRDETGKHIISPEGVEEEREAGMDEQMIQSEFYNSFDSGLVGAYYTDQLNRAKKEGRVGDFPWIETEPVQTWWDLGVGDDCTITFTQRDGEYCRVIDYMSGSGKGLLHWLKVVQEQPYLYEIHNFPHDIEQRELISGKKRTDTLEKLGIPYEIVPKLSIDEGIDASRRHFGMCRFNEKNVGDLIDCCYNYRREWDEKNKVFKPRPHHDWASHGADNFRYLSVGWYQKASSMSSLTTPFRKGRKPTVKRAVGGRRGRLRA